MCKGRLFHMRHLFKRVTARSLAFAIRVHARRWRLLAPVEKERELRET
jgi:hypothetical protein